MTFFFLLIYFLENQKKRKNRNVMLSEKKGGKKVGKECLKKRPERMLYEMRKVWRKQSERRKN